MQEHAFQLARLVDAVDPKQSSRSQREANGDDGIVMECGPYKSAPQHQDDEHEEAPGYGRP